MRAQLSIVQEWKKSGKLFAVATVIETIGSSPQPVGSQMLIREDGAIDGAVSGGCVESAVIQEAREVLANRQRKFLHFGVEDEVAWNVGLSCGGKIQLFLDIHPAVHPSDAVRSLWERFQSTVQKNLGAVWIVDLTTPVAEQSIYGMWDVQNQCTTVPADLSAEDASVLRAVAEQMYRERSFGTQRIGERAFFFHIVPPPEKLLLLGAGFPAFSLLLFAKQLGMETIVIDPRKVFADPARFVVPPDSLYHKWPSEILPQLSLDEETYAVVLSHDPKIDDDALAYLLRSPVRYIGALGSRKTHQKRCERLQKMGFSLEELRRISAPVGIPIAARTPEEIAVSIIAEIITVRRNARQVE